jgi:hypothetical protein
MREPAPHRLHPFEAEWLTLLIRMGVATEQEARQAVGRICREAAGEMLRRELEGDDGLPPKRRRRRRRE